MRYSSFSLSLSLSLSLILTYTHVYALTCSRTHTYSHTRKYARTHTHTHTHVHTNTYIILIISIWTSIKSLVWFYGTSTLVGYLMPDTVHTHIFNMICEYIFSITFLKMNLSTFFCTQLNHFKYFYETGNN